MFRFCWQSGLGDDVRENDNMQQTSIGRALILRLSREFGYGWHTQQLNYWDAVFLFMTE